MRKLKYVVLSLVVITISACSDNLGHALVLNDIVIDINENPTTDLIIKLVATDSEQHTLTYSIASQVPLNSISIEETTGEVFIANPNAFDYEQNTSIVAKIKVSDGVVEVTSQLTINIIDIND